MFGEGEKKKKKKYYFLIIVQNCDFLCSYIIEVESMANTEMSSSFTLSLVLLFIISLNSFLTSAIISDKFASNIDEPSSLRLVYTIERPRNEEPEAFYIQILTPVLGRYVFLKKLFKETIAMCLNENLFNVAYIITLAVLYAVRF